MCLDWKSVAWDDAFSVVDRQINAAGIHLWPFDPAFPLDLRFFIAGGPNCIRMNRHRYNELLYVYRGQMDLRVQGRQFRLNRGDLAVIGGSLYHGITSSNPVKVVALYFEPELVTGGPEREDIGYLGTFACEGDDFSHVVPKESGVPEEVAGFMRRIQAELPAASSRSRLAAKTWLKAILVLLANHYAGYLEERETVQRKQKALDRLTSLFDYLEAHYSEPVRVGDAARICGMSNSYFMSFFAQATGQPFAAYLNRFRVIKAQALLISLDLPISEISQSTGFCDQSHFGRVFQKFAGMTPLTYRKRFARPGRVTPRFEDDAPAHENPLLLDQRVTGPLSSPNPDSVRPQVKPPEPSFRPQPPAG